jgi:hypothetical protein
MSESQLLEERDQLKAAIDWIDKERQSLKRGSFNATRMRGSGRGFHITLMKKKGEWLFGQRNRIRDRLSSVNGALKERRMARNGCPSETFATTFFRLAKDNLEESTFHELRQMAETEFPREGERRLREGAGDKTVLQVLQNEMKRFIDGASPNLKPRVRQPCERPGPRNKESQEDFGIHNMPGEGVGREFPKREGRRGGVKVMA